MHTPLSEHGEYLGNTFHRVSGRKTKEIVGVTKEIHKGSTKKDILDLQA